MSFGGRLWELGQDSMAVSGPTRNTGTGASSDPGPVSVPILGMQGNCTRQLCWECRGWVPGAQSDGHGQAQESNGSLSSIYSDPLASAS